VAGFLYFHGRKLCVFGGRFQYCNCVTFDRSGYEKTRQCGLLYLSVSIIYLCKCQTPEWKSPINYKAFQVQEKRRKKAKYQLEKREFLKGPEVKALLKYCEEPRKLTEMIDFLGKYSTKNAFSRIILKPLMDQGKIKRTIPDQPIHILQKYYSVKK
jgi:hypothetical protein